MDYVSRAVTSLRQAEKSLRILVSEAAASGDYTSVVQIAAWARTVNEILPSNVASPAKKSQEPARNVVAEPSGTRHMPHQNAKEYPRFFRDDDALVRIAWSKKEKREYLHKAPLMAIRAMVAVMSEAGKDGRVFSTDQFLPLRDEEGMEVPSYQAYVGLALLKQTALIDQHGRKGYSIPRLSAFKGAVESILQQLPKQ